MTSFQREQQTDDSSIQSYNFGGLNTTASRLNVPFNDATVLRNVNTGLDGSLLKRKGTKKLGVPTANSVGYGVSIRSVLGYSYSVIANGVGFAVYSRNNDEYVTERVFSQVYTVSGQTAPQSTQWVQLPDTYSRVLALRGDRPPVEVYLLEQRYPTTSFAAVNTLTVSTKFTGDHNSVTSAPFLDTLYITRGDGTKLVYRAGELNYTYNPGTKLATVTLPFTFNSGENVSYDVVGVRWCWWAESLTWLGDRFYDSLSRFNVTANDNNIAIPPGLRSDSRTGEESLVITISRTSSTADNYTLVNQPLTADQYNLSDGAVYVPGTNNFLQPAPFFVTFGAARTPLPQPPESIKVLRYRELRFNQGVPLSASDLRVTVNSSIATVNYTGSPTGSNRYQLFNASVVQCTGPSQPASYIGFSGSVPMGVGAIDFITLTNTNPRWVFNTVNQEFEESVFASGAYRRVYGLGLFADYGTVGSFPSVGCVYQGRLALSGITSDKSRILVSSIDVSVDRYSYFQITDDLDGLPTDPFDIVVSGGDSADYIVGMVEWNSSLFALTRRSVYRISGGDQPLTATRRLVTYISNIGLVNPRCIARTDTAVYYLSDGGVFNLTPRVEDSEFAAIEKSLKVRDLVLRRGATQMEQSACMYFDSRQRRLYVALPNESDGPKEASDIFVFDTVRESWTVYDTLGGMAVQSFYESIDNISGGYSVVVSSNVFGNLLLEYERTYTDNTVRYTGNTTYNHNIIVGAGVPTVEGNQRYDIPDNIQYTPIHDVRDIRVLVGLINPVDVMFTKYDGYVYLDVPTVAGQFVWFVSRSPVNDSPQGLLRYGAGNRYPYTLWKQDTVIPPANESIVYNTTTREATLTVSWTGLTTDVFWIGTHYVSVYVSSMFTQQVLGTLKRTKHAYLYFNNGESSTYTSGAEIEAYNTRINVNIAMMYDSSDTDSVTSTDIYGYQDIVWDNAYFDTVESSERRDQYTLFKEPLIGIGYSYRLCVFNHDEGRWNLVGYQIDASRNKGLRYIGQD